jgi:DNA-binding MarR family transcriptional regulator
MSEQKNAYSDYVSVIRHPLRKLFRPYPIVIMKLLDESVKKEGIPFQQLKKDLQLTDGNLASHLRCLEQQEYIIFEKVSRGHRVWTVYKLTDRGKEVLDTCIELLRRILLSGDSKSQ